MLCQLCDLNSASVTISYLIHDKKISMNLCKECAEKKGVDNPMTTLPQMFGNFITQLLGEDSLKRSKPDDDVKCDACGLTWDSFEKTGLFGCDICYQVFSKDLNVILRRIHGSNQHIGNRPKSQRYLIDDSELKKIKLDLQAAVANEDFELAAELRDMIRDAQSSLNEKVDDGILR